MESWTLADYWSIGRKGLDMTEATSKEQSVGGERNTIPFIVTYVHYLQIYFQGYIKYDCMPVNEWTEKISHWSGSVIYKIQSQYENIEHRAIHLYLCRSHTLCSVLQDTIVAERTLRHCELLKNCIILENFVTGKEIFRRWNLAKSNPGLCSATNLLQTSSTNMALTSINPKLKGSL